MEKRVGDGGFMLLKHGKYCGFRKVALFSKIRDFLDLGMALGSHFGRFG